MIEFLEYMIKCLILTTGALLLIAIIESIIETLISKIAISLSKRKLIKKLTDELEKELTKIEISPEILMQHPELFEEEEK